MASADRAAAASAPRPRGRPRKTPEERDEGNRRTALVRAAARRFRQQGFAAAATRDIAQDVGMQPGSPFYFFPNKEALLAEVMVSGMHQALRHQRQVLLQTPVDEAPHRRLRTLVRCHFDVLLGPDSDFIPVMLYEWRSLPAEHRAVVKRLRAQYEWAWLPVLHQLHRRGQLRAPVHLAQLLVFGALNWTVQWYREPAPCSLDALTDAAVSLFLSPPQPRGRRSAPPSA